MELKIETENGFKIVSVSGKVDANSSPELQETITELIRNGSPNLIIDLEECFYISSAGLQVALVAAKMIHGKGKLAFARMQEGVREVFEMTGFDTILNIYDELNTAKEMFSGGGGS
jgi:anti-anti-sigma factor